MEKQEMLDFLKARGLLEPKMGQLVNWQLMAMVEEAIEMGLPSEEEIKEMEEVEEPKEEPKKEKPKAKPKAKPKTKKKDKKA